MKQTPKTDMSDDLVDRMILAVLCQMDWGNPLPEALEFRSLRHLRFSPIYEDEKTVAWWEGVDGKQIRINDRPLISLKRAG